ncbi:MAG: hypothetical protein JXJ22_14025 [Bacteroidales bacterium]|nr:hypothetical protein [Bacteroidales bacterium]
MAIRRYITFTIIGILYFGQLSGQGEIDDLDKIFYRNERTYAFLLNSNGIAGNFRFARRMDAFKKTLYEVDFAHVKHSKEIKLTNTSYPTRSFVYGKVNQVFFLRGGFGLQKELFRKFDRGGISIRYFYNIGPSLSLLKPIYYEVLYYNSNPLEANELRIEKFEVGQHTTTGYIQGKASFFKGFNEISVVPGGYAKLGVTFEFSKFDEIFHSLEAGVIFDTFLKDIPIMAVEKNNQFFFTLFISYRFGRVINAQFKEKKTKLDEIIVN